MQQADKLDFERVGLIHTRQIVETMLGQESRSIQNHNRIDQQEANLKERFWKTVAVRIGEVSKRESRKTKHALDTAFDARKRTLNKFHNENPIFLYSIQSFYSDSLLPYLKQVGYCFMFYGQCYDCTSCFVVVSCGHF